VAAVGKSGYLYALHRSDLTLRTRAGFAVGVVLTVPPYPYVRTTPKSPTGLRIHFRAPLNADEQHHLHYAEVALKDGKLVIKFVNTGTQNPCVSGIEIIPA